MRKKWTVLVYSENWVCQTALENICQADSRVLCLASPRRGRTYSQKKLTEPDMVILDFSPRKCVTLIIEIRQTWPGACIFFTRNAFLFSDRVVADFFGGIWLREYDAIMAGMPGFHFTQYLTSPAFAGAYAPARQLTRQADEDEIMRELNLFLRKRLSQLISLRAVDIVFRWFLRDTPLSEICRQSGLKEKTVYHYREQAMRLLHIRHYARDFSASLTVIPGERPSRLVQDMFVFLTGSHRT